MRRIVVSNRVWSWRVGRGSTVIQSVDDASDKIVVSNASIAGMSEHAYERACHKNGGVEITPRMVKNTILLFELSKEAGD